MQLSSRIKKLEKLSPLSADYPQVMFVSWDGKDSCEFGFAIIPGSGFGQIEREDGESEAAFCRRVYAMKIANKPVEEMTDDELETVMAAADEAIALENAKTGTLSDETLEANVGLSK